MRDAIVGAAAFLSPILAVLSFAALVRLAGWVGDVRRRRREGGGKKSRKPR